MEEITLQQLLEAGCHFGHKAERWNPKVAEFIYTKKDGIHIIDLAKTREGLLRAMDFIEQVCRSGKQVLFVATKRQAKGIVEQEAVSSSAPFLVERWIGGFLTNWDHIKKNIEKIKRMSEEQAAGAWKKFPKHEQIKLAHYLTRLKVFYGGVLELKELPGAIFVVDVKKEEVAVREAKRMGIPLVAIVDTNADPSDIDYVIAANDDAVGSIQLIVKAIAASVRKGQEAHSKEKEAIKVKESGTSNTDKSGSTIKPETKVKESSENGKKKPSLVTEKPAKKRGRAKKRSVERGENASKT